MYYDGSFPINNDDSSGVNMSLTIMVISINVLSLLAKVTLNRIRRFSATIANTQIPAVADRLIKRMKYLIGLYRKLTLLNLIVSMFSFMILTEYAHEYFGVEKYLIVDGIVSINVILNALICTHAMTISSMYRRYTTDVVLTSIKPIMFYVTHITLTTCLVFILMVLK